MRHIDDYDDQIKQQERIKIGYKFNFKSMYMLIGRIIEEKGEYDEHYPKDGLYRLWGCAMAVLFILTQFSRDFYNKFVYGGNSAFHVFLWYGNLSGVQGPKGI